MKAQIRVSTGKARVPGTLGMFSSHLQDPQLAALLSRNLQLMAPS